MRRATVFCLSFAICAAACKKSGSAANDDGGSEMAACTHPIGASTLSAPYALPASGTVTTYLCPVGWPGDYYGITVPAGQSLIDLDVGYKANALTKVKLSATLYQTDGTAVPQGNIEDTTTNGVPSHLITTFNAPAGNYVLQIQPVDPTTQADAKNSYTLIIKTGSDPDTHEPNDTAMMAKATDSAPGWFAYRGDVDDFTVHLNAGQLVELALANNTNNAMPTTNATTLQYTLTDSMGAVKLQDKVLPTQSEDNLHFVGLSGGDYLLSLTPATDSPDRTAGAGYTVSLSARNDPDTNEGANRNDTAATATCLDGTSGNGSACATPFTGTGPQSGFTGQSSSKTGYIASLGDHDVYRLDISGSVSTASVVEASVVTHSSKLALSLSLVTPDTTSPCTTDTDCGTLKKSCSNDVDCELSHYCNSGHCASSDTCVPGTSGNFCGALQYVFPRPAEPQNSLPKPDGSGNTTIAWAQPLFSTGPYYIVVRDAADANFDLSNTYTLNVHVFAEPDHYDQSTTPSGNNNFYDPLFPINNDTPLYPNADMSSTIIDSVYGIDKMRAAHIDPVANLITGYLSYQDDEDWYSFTTPVACQPSGRLCGLVFAVNQPQSANGMKAQFFLLTSDLQVRESWIYSGNTTMSGGMYQFGATSAENDCSFIIGSGHADTYYVQVRDAGLAYESAMPYTFQMTVNGPTMASPMGTCPAACSYILPSVNNGMGCGPGSTPTCASTKSNGAACSH